MISQESFIKLCLTILNERIAPYHIKLRQILAEDEEWLYGFRHILQAFSLIVYLGKHHVAIEYLPTGFVESVHDNAERIVNLSYHFLPDEEEILDQVLGYDKPDIKPEFRIPILAVIENLFVPLGDSLDYMVKNGWNIDAQMRHQSTMMAFGPGSIGLTIAKDTFGSIRNSFFYRIGDDGKLKVRHLNWVYLIPIKVAETEESWNISLWTPEIDDLVASALDYEPPELKKSQLDKLVKLNRFVELINTSDTSEVKITQFLARPENQFILKLYFAGKAVHHEIQLEWQNRPDRADIRPDFFVTMPNGFADIVDFKLASLEYEPVRGKDNRKRFNWHLTEYVAQLRDYRNYFDDYANRKYAEETFGIKASKPTKYLIIGRRKDFEDDDWRNLQDDYKDLSIVTYDDLIDAVTSAVYLIVE